MDIFYIGTAIFAILNFARLAKIFLSSSDDLTWFGEVMVTASFFWAMYAITMVVG